MTAHLFTQGNFRIGNLRVCRDEKVFMDWQKLPNGVSEGENNTCFSNANGDVVRLSWQAED